MRKKINNFISKKYLFAASLVYGLTAAHPVFAKVGDSISVNEGFDPEDALGKVLGLLAWIVQGAGAVIAIWGIYSLAQSIIQDRPESRSKAILEILGGGIAVGAVALLRTLGILTG